MPDLLTLALASGSAFSIAFYAWASRSPPNRLALRWFGLFVLSVGFALLGHIGWQEDYSRSYPYLAPVCELTRFAMAPALYLSVWHFTHPQKMESTRIGWHFLPMLLFAGGLLPFFLDALGISTVATRSGWLPPGFSRGFGQLMGYVIKVQLVVYWISSFWLVNRHQHHIRLLSATIQHIRLRWLYGLLATVATMIGLWLFQVFVPHTHLDHYIGEGYLGAIFLMSYFLIRQPEVFTLGGGEKQEAQALLNEQDGLTVPPKSVRLQPDEMRELKVRLDKLLSDEKLFMEPDLDLANLAKRLLISMNDLSFLINEGYGVNFFTLINRCRIQEAKRLLLSPAHRHLSILGIAYEVGFTSKTTFNTTFKKQVGQTPTAYVKTADKPEDVPLYPSERES